MAAPARRPRGARAAVTFTFLAHGALYGTWVARIPAIKRGLELGDAQLGLALFAAAAGALLAMPVAGWAVARRGSRALTSAGLLAHAAALPLLALAPSLPLLAVSLFAFGAAAGALDVAMNAHGVTVERRYERPVISSFHAAFSVGGLAGAGVAAPVAALGVAPLRHFAAVSVLLAAGTLACRPLLLAAAADRGTGGRVLVRPPRRIVALGLVVFATFFAEGAAADWSAVYLAGPLGAGDGIAALAFAAFSVAMVAGRLAGDRLTARWGPEALTRGGAVLGAAGLGGALAIGHPAAGIAGLACMGAGLAAVAPVAYRAAGTTPGVPTGTGIAAVTTIGYTGFLVGPPLVGFAAEATSLPLGLVLVVAAAAALLPLAPATAPARTASRATSVPAPEALH